MNYIWIVLLYVSLTDLSNPFKEGSMIRKWSGNETHYFDGLKMSRLMLRKWHVYRLSLLRGMIWDESYGFALWGDTQMWRKSFEMTRIIAFVPIRTRKWHESEPNVLRFTLRLTDEIMVWGVCVTQMRRKSFKMTRIIAFSLMGA